MSECLYISLFSAKSSQMDDFLTQYDSVYSALTNAYTLAKSSQMDDFFTKYDSMYSALYKCTCTSKTLTNGKFSHPMNPALTNAYIH